MKRSVNPGSFLEVEGRFELGLSLADTTAGRIKRPGDWTLVRDMDTGNEVSLAGLLRSFLEDPADRVTGPIRIRIEATPI